MRKIIVIHFIVIFAFVLIAPANHTALCGTGKYYYTSVPPGEKDKYQSAEYRIWIPDNVKSIRGIIVHQHGCGRNGLSAPYDVHWQALAKKWDCALMGTFYYTGKSCESWYRPENGSGNAFQESIKKFADLSNHPELINAPWVLWGHSGGAFWVGKMLNLYPERIIAAFPRSGGEYNSNPEALSVPVMFNYGAGESGRVNGKTYFTPGREKNAIWSIAPDTTTAHGCGNSRLLAIPFFDACLAQRLSSSGIGYEGLKPMDRSKAWLGNPETHSITPASKYQENKNTASWLPDESTAKRWQELVKKGWVTDHTPPVSSPVNLKAKELGNTIVEIVWDALADLESGIKTFYIYRDGKKIGEFIGPNDNHNNKGFQFGNYGDDPIPEVFYRMPESWNPTEMKYIDRGLTPGNTYTYQISTANWSDLESAKSLPITIKLKEL